MNFVPIAAATRGLIAKLSEKQQHSLKLNNERRAQRSAAICTNESVVNMRKGFSERDERDMSYEYFPCWMNGAWIPDGASTGIVIENFRFVAEA